VTWYAHLDEIKEDWDALATAGKLPDCKVHVTPAPPEPHDALERIHRRASTVVFLSMAGADDNNEAAYPGGTMLCVAHIYSRDGHTSKHGQEYERNRLAALICEQLHIVLRDPTQYCIDAPSGRSWQVGRGADLRFRNYSFRSYRTVDGEPESPDTHGLAHWVMTWRPDFTSEPMSADVLNDLTSIYVTAKGDELGGDNPDSGDDETTSVEYS
jgi:hypothetical protein